MWWHESDHPDAQPTGGAAFVGEVALEDHEGLDQRRRGRPVRSGDEYVRGDIGKLGARQRRAEKVEPVVELVVAEARRRIVELVHRLEDRMDLAGCSRCSTAT